MKKYSSLIIFFCFMYLGAYAQLNINLLASLDWEQNCNDVWGYYDGNREYALVGTRTGLSIVEVTDPSTPNELFFTPGYTSTWRDIKTWQHYAYVVNETQGGVHIVDLSSLPSTIDTSAWIGGLWQGDSIAIESAHNIFIDENGFAYIIGGDAFGVLIVDISTNPTNPSIVGHYTEHYVHDVFVRGDTMWTAEIYNGTFSVVDINDKANPTVLASQETPHSFTHNIWLSDDGNYAFTTDEISGAYITAYDVSDINDIQETDRFQSSPGEMITPHNAFFLNNFLVNSYYSDGVVVLDATYPNLLVEVGNYKTSNEGMGCWGVYPYLPSGIVLATDMVDGLSVLGVDYVQAAYLDGLVLNADNGQAVFNAELTIAGLNTSFSGLMGDFFMGTPYSGEVLLTVGAYGYETQNITVTLNNGTITTVGTINLVPIPSFTVNIQLLDAFTLETVNDAVIELDSSSPDIEKTYFSSDATGNVGLVLFSNTDNYTLTVGKWGYKTTQITDLYFNETTGTYVVYLEKGYYDDFYFDYSWTVDGTATTGFFERAIPNGVSFAGEAANPYLDDPLDYGNYCYVTGNGESTGDNVGGGVTRLTSPFFDLSTYNNPTISYERWVFFQGSSNDTMQVLLSDGSTSKVVETIVNGDEFESLWHKNTLLVSDYFETFTNNMQLIVTVGDAPSMAHIVEGGLDVFEVNDAATPEVLLFSNNNTGCAPLNVQFEATATNNPISWSWIFEGGTVINATNNLQEVWFDTPGVYTVSLVVTNAYGETTEVYNDYVTVLDPPTAISITVSDEISEVCVGDSIVLNAQNTPDGSTYTWSEGTAINPTASSVTVNPNEGDNIYTLTVNSNGCITTISTTILGITAPSLNLSGNPTSLCLGDSITLNAVCNSMVYWYNDEASLVGQGNSITVNPSTTTNYTAVAGSQCNTSGTINIAVYDVPDFTLQGNLPDIILAGYEDTYIYVVLSDNSDNYSFNWQGEYISSYNSNTVIIDAPYEAVGNTYTYTLTLTHLVTGCSSSQSITLAVELYDGIQQIGSLQSLEAYPNPSTGLFTIDLSTNFIPTTIKVYNTLGQQINEHYSETSVNQATIDLSEQGIGLYYAVLYNAQQRYTIKLLRK